ncbi:hypothetical protein ACFWYW_42250 [Nonomuraea sp. NPDC059023]|uniref:hypothetical protein n=1 Tax=unclassified Nonomuraea TaxID=2593643 RepID=UPI0036ADC5F9
MVSLLRAAHRPLVIASGLLAVVMLVSLAGMVVDGRTLLGESVWVKPLKFGFAFALYAVTLAWLLTLLTKAKRFGWWLGTVIAVCVVVDVGAITFAAARGTFSHFNLETDPVTSFTTQVLIYGVPPVFVSNLIIAVLVLVQRVGDRAMTTAIRAGLVLAVHGTAVPYWMAFVGGIKERTVLNANGERVKMVIGHGIGDPDGTGMPLTNWSVTGGDMRVPHFIGMHGIHALLILTLVLGALAARVAWLRTEKVRARLVGVGAFGYIGLTALVTWQAARGQSLVHPDAVTAGVFTAIVLATLAAVITGARREPRLVAAEGPEHA